MGRSIRASGCWRRDRESDPAWSSVEPIAGETSDAKPPPLGAPIHRNSVGQFLELFRKLQKLNAARSGSGFRSRPNVRSPMPVVRDSCLSRLCQELEDAGLFVIHIAAPRWREPEKVQRNPYRESPRNKS